MQDVKIRPGFKFVSRQFEGAITVDSISEPDNVINVTIDRPSGPESALWDLDHVAWGFQEGVYAPLSEV